MDFSAYINCKRISFLRKWAFMCVISLGITSTALAQNTYDTLLDLQVLELEKKSQLAADILYFGYGYELREKSDIGFLNPMEYKHLDKTFYSGNSYTIMVLGSSLANINVYLYDHKGKLVTYDSLIAVDGVIEFNVFKSGAFRIVIGNESTDFGTPVNILYGYKN